jgi:hypothetical protein
MTYEIWKHPPTPLDNSILNPIYHDKKFAVSKQAPTSRRVVEAKQKLESMNTQQSLTLELLLFSRTRTYYFTSNTNSSLLLYSQWLPPRTERMLRWTNLKTCLCSFKGCWMIWYARREHIFLLERFWTPSLSVTNNTAFIRVSHYRIHSLLKWKTISWAAWAPWASVWITWNEVSWTC